MQKLSRKANYMARLIVVYIIADFMLTPLGGLETRPISKITTLGYTTLALLFVGLALNVACLVLTLRHYRRSPIFGIIGSILYFPAMIADQTGLFSSLSPPIGIIYVELIEAVVAIGIIVLGTLVLREKPEGASSNYEKSQKRPYYPPSIDSMFFLVVGILLLSLHHSSSTVSHQGPDGRDRTSYRRSSCVGLVPEPW